MFELTVKDTFAAAHNLRGYKGQCENLHGHNWRVEVVVASNRLDDLGMVMDFRDLKKGMATVLDRLDHSYLNDAAPFDKVNPTTENICVFVSEQLAALLPEGVVVRRVSCWESERCSATYLVPEGGTKGAGQ